MGFDVKGQIVDLNDDTAWVDCGGVELPLESLTNDKSVIGEWIGFSIDRLEVEGC